MSDEAIDRHYATQHNFAGSPFEVEDMDFDNEDEEQEDAV